MSNKPLLELVNEFLTESGMGPTYFGKLAANNTELVNRLRAGRPVLTSTEQRAREFIMQRSQMRSPVNPAQTAAE